MRRTAAVLTAATGLVLSGAGSASAWWGGLGAGTSTRQVDTLPSSAPAPDVVAAAGAVSVTFARQSTSSGAPLTAYRLSRYADGLAGPPTVLPCTALSAAVVCTDTGSAGALVRYTYTPVIGSAWTGVASAPSVAVSTDTTAPVVTVTATPTLTNAARVEGVVAATDLGGSGLASLEVTLDGSATAADFAVTTEGTHVLRWTATDAAGNASTGSRTITIDRTGPALAVTSPTGTVTGSPGFDGTTDEATTVDVSVYRLGQATPVRSGSVTPVNGAWTLAGAPLADGTYQVRVAQADAAGNASAAVSDFVVSNPIAVSAAGGNGNSTRGGGKITGTGPTGGIVTVQVLDAAGVAQAAFKQGATSEQTTVDAGAWSVNYRDLVSGQQYTVVATYSAVTVTRAFTA